jgi:hypothetical protein
VLVHALQGFLDAGNAAALATSHLLAQAPRRVVASFDIDARVGGATPHCLVE